jgi:anti-sigma regulatory factor (Ser/Thr protein kinase)
MRTTLERPRQMNNSDAHPEIPSWFHDTPEPQLSRALVRDSFHLTIPSRPEWVVPTVEFLCERAAQCGACRESRLPGLTVALHEALTNSVIHGNLELSSALKEEGDDAFAQALAVRAADPLLSNRPVDIQVDYDGERICWTFTDRGRGFNVEAALARAASDDPEVLLASGRGLTLMQAFLDEVRFELGGRRVRLVLRHGVEKRREARQPMLESVHVAPVAHDGSIDWEQAHEALARDLSSHGIGLVQSKLAAGARLLIGMENDGKLVYLPAEVRHCEKLDDGLVRIGCHFPLSEDRSTDDQRAEATEAVQSLLEVLDSEEIPHDERRNHRRAVYTERITISGGPGPEIGFSRNLSRGGIAFLTSRPLPLEQRLLTLPCPDAPPLRLTAEIVRCVPLTDNLYEVGARFLELVG